MLMDGGCIKMIGILVCDDIVLHLTWKSRLLACACAFGKDVIKDMLMLKMMFLQRDMCMIKDTLMTMLLDWMIGL